MHMLYVNRMSFSWLVSPNILHTATYWSAGHTHSESVGLALKEDSRQLAKHGDAGQTHSRQIIAVRQCLHPLNDPPPGTPDDRPDRSGAKINGGMQRWVPEMSVRRKNRRVVVGIPGPPFFFFCRPKSVGAPFCLYYKRIKTLGGKTVSPLWEANKVHSYPHFICSLSGKIYQYKSVCLGKWDPLCFTLRLSRHVAWGIEIFSPMKIATVFPVLVSVKLSIIFSSVWPRKTNLSQRKEVFSQND